MSGSRSYGGGGRQVRTYNQPRGKKWNHKNNRYGGSFGRDRDGGGNRGPGPRSRLEDDDIAMDGQEDSSSRRFSPYGRPAGISKKSKRGGKKLAMDQVNKGALKRLGLPVSNQRSRDYTGARDRARGTDPEMMWFKVTIPHGKKADKNFILQSITNLSDEPFVPVHFHYEQQTALFYVQGQRAADAIRRVSRRVTLPNGFKMMIFTKASGAPSIPMNSDTVEKLKVAMSNRYDPATKSLNLSYFYNDEEMKKHGIHLALNRFSVMSNVLNVIHENIPELTSLDLSGNRLMSLENMRSLHTRAPDLCRLNLSKNQLKSEHELDNIRDVKMEELSLDKNPLCDNFREESAYISAVRKRFPKVLKLDGHVLPPPITFDVESPEKLPETKGSHFGNDEVKNLLSLFLDQYFSIYDSDNRQPLLNAYHDQALFSMCLLYNKLITGRQDGFHENLQNSRNLIRVKEPARKSKVLVSGRLNVVAQLTQLPQTKHDPASFVVDVNHIAPSLLNFTVHGIFKETNTKAIRAFSRNFITVPQGNGIVIINEELTYTNATQEQIKKSFRTTAPTPSSSPILPSPAVPVPSTSGASGQQQEMVHQFALQSGMNEEWSSKCLMENNWDYEKAGRVFTELQAKGAIPAEAFVK